MIVEGAMRKNHTLTINLEQKIPPAVKQVGFTIRYKRGRSGLAIGYGEGIDRGPFYTPAPHRN